MPLRSVHTLGASVGAIEGMRTGMGVGVETGIAVSGGARVTTGVGASAVGVGRM